MIKHAFCYRATDSGLYGDIWLSPEDGRHVKAGLIAGAETGHFAESFLKRTDLFELGEYEDETGIFTPYDKPVFVMSLSEVLPYVRHAVQSPEE